MSKNLDYMMVVEATIANQLLDRGLVPNLEDYRVTVTSHRPLHQQGEPAQKAYYRTTVRNGDPNFLLSIHALRPQGSARKATSAFELTIPPNSIDILL